MLNSKYLLCHRSLTQYALLNQMECSDDSSMQPGSGAVHATSPKAENSHVDGNLILYKGVCTRQIECLFPAKQPKEHETRFSNAHAQSVMIRRLLQVRPVVVKIYSCRANMFRWWIRLWMRFQRNQCPSQACMIPVVSLQLPSGISSFSNLQVSVT